MFKSKSVPTWLCVVLGLWQVIQQIVWRSQDLNQPVPDLRYWLSDLLIVAAIAVSWLMTRRKDPGHVEVGLEALEFLKCQADPILHEYRHLDHDYRENVELPLAENSWPDFGEPWSYVQVRLMVLHEQLMVVASLSRALCKRNNWKEDYVTFFQLSASTKMLDVILALEEFLVWKPSAKEAL